MKRMAFLACLTLAGGIAAEPAMAACEPRDLACEAKTVCVRFVGAGADWFPRPPRPGVPRPRPHP